MFRASSRPSSGATTAAVAASGLPSERGGSSAVGRGRSGQTVYFTVYDIFKSQFSLGEIHREDARNSDRNMLVIKMLLKYIINSEVRFVSYLYIMIRYMISIYIGNCNWVDNRWQ
jgi:hypothetical protein